MTVIDHLTAERIGMDWVLAQLSLLSPYGRHLKSRIRAARPGCEGWISREWALVERFMSQVPQDILGELQHCLGSFREIRGTVKKACQGNVLEDIDLFELKRFLGLTERLAKTLRGLEFLPARYLVPTALDLQAALAFGGSGDGFYLSDSFSPLLATLRSEQRRLKSKLSKQRGRLRARVSVETGKEFNTQGRLRLSKLSPECARLLSHKDLTLVAEGYSEMEFCLRDDEQMQTLAMAINSLEEKVLAEEHQVRCRLSQKTVKACRPLLAACRRIGRVDLLLAKGQLAKRIGWCVPQLSPQPELILAQFINPVVDSYLKREGLCFQPVSLRLDQSVTVITGANMGGKSVALRSVGLAVAMAQMGLLVPAQACRLSLRDFIYYSQQEEDTIQGLSAFGAEIRGLAQVLPLRNERGLYLLDEPARGTNPREGTALVRSLVAWLGEGNSITVLATHFPSFSNLRQVRHLQVAGLDLSNKDIDSMDLGSLQRMMDYSLIPGTGEVPHDALKIAAFLGLAPEIIKRASQELGINAQEVLKK